MTLADVLKPAISYAEDGHAVPELVSGYWHAAAGRLDAGPAGGELLKDGRPPDPGDVIRMPQLARTLRAIAEGGADAFYKGPMARRIASFVQDQGGWLTEEDMAAHAPRWVEPIQTTYRGRTCWQCPPPSQGVNALVALNLAQGFDLKAMGLGSIEAYHHLIECMRLAMVDTLSYVTDPSHMQVAVADLLSKSYADSRRRLIGADKAMAEVEAGVPPGHPDTVYVSCVDGQGNACSFINSLYMGFGTGLVVPGTGIALQNRGASFSLDPGHPNALAPNKQPFHTLIAGMVTESDGMTHCYGVMGGMQQAQGHLQVLSNLFDFGLSPQQALDAPRFSLRVGDSVYLEETVGPEISEGLRAMGHPITVREPHGIFFGSGQVIRRDPDTGALTGGSEPRADGAAMGW
jgi:gamma-glutamyltranspeptidase/glutathione hydrolase